MDAMRYVVDRCLLVSEPVEEISCRFQNGIPDLVDIFHDTICKADFTLQIFDQIGFSVSFSSKILLFLWRVRLLRFPCTGTEGHVPFLS